MAVTGQLLPGGTALGRGVQEGRASGARQRKEAGASRASREAAACGGGAGWAGPGDDQGRWVGARGKVEEGRVWVIPRWELVGKKVLTRVSARTDYLAPDAS
jgi:hypothetical protein